MKLYLFPHPDTDTTIGVLAHSKKEALKLLKEQREDVYILTLLDELSPAVLDKPTLLYVGGGEQMRGYGLHRAPGTCCPEPSCDYSSSCKVCEMCGADCSRCKRRAEHGR